MHLVHYQSCVHLNACIFIDFAVNQSPSEFAVNQFNFFFLSCHDTLNEWHNLQHGKLNGMR